MRYAGVSPPVFVGGSRDLRLVVTVMIEARAALVCLNEASAPAFLQWVAG